jgi:hypothetical protein
MSGAIDDYVASLRRELDFDPALAHRLTSEVEDHLRDAAPIRHGRRPKPSAARSNASASAARSPHNSRSMPLIAKRAGPGSRLPSRSW